ncbi:MAG: glutathione S-transferase, partial [Pseudomonadota bacterium]
RVRVFIAEKGIDIPVQQVDLASGEQLGEAFLARNPDATVPVLELDDGSCLTETLAICDYIESQHPEPPLLDGDAKARAQVLMWNARIEQQGLAAVAEAFRNFSKGFANRSLTGPHNFEQIPELVTRGRTRAELFLHKLDEQLEGRDFVLGEALTMADITALVVVDMAGWIKLPVPEACDNLSRWHESMSARPSARL